MNSVLQKSTDKTPQTDDFILNSNHQIQVLDTPRQMLKDSEHVPDLLHWENPLESKETKPKNQSQSTKAISHSSHPSDDSDAIRLYQTSKKTDQRHNSQISSKVLPVYHRFNASSVLNHHSVLHQNSTNLKLLVLTLILED